MKHKLEKLSKELLSLNLIDDAEKILKLGQEQISENDIVISTLLGEASVDGMQGMTAVYSIINNRAAHKGMSKKNICLEPKQFSMWNNKQGDLVRREFINNQRNAPGGRWKEAERVVMGGPSDITKGSTHYYTGSTPYWASSKNPCWIPRAKIGSHTFGIDLSISWVNVNNLPADIIAAYVNESKRPARCYVDKPERYPPASVRGQ